MKRVGIPCRPRARPLIAPATSEATEEPDSDRCARRRKLDDKLVSGEVSFQEIPPMSTELIFNQAKSKPQPPLHGIWILLIFRKRT